MSTSAMIWNVNLCTWITLDEDGELEFFNKNGLLQGHAQVLQSR